MVFSKLTTLHRSAHVYPAIHSLQRIADHHRLNLDEILQVRIRGAGKIMICQTRRRSLGLKNSVWHIDAREHSAMQAPTSISFANSMVVRYQSVERKNKLTVYEEKRL